MIPLLLLACAPGAFAAYNCGYDYYGRYRCSGLSNPARLGIGIGIAVLTVLAFTMIIMLRKRRLRQANEAYIHNPNQAPYHPHPHPQPQYQHYPPQQYPTQPSYDPSNQWSNSYYNTQQGGWNAGAPMGTHPDNQSQPYAPPPGAPPSYTPPAHPPPTKEHV